jgi:hypothetical protein
MMRLRTTFLSLSGVALLGVGLATGNIQTKKVAAKSIKTMDYNRDIRPILSDHCFKCHGPDGKEVKGNFRISDAKDATRDRKGYFAIKPGSSQNSLLMEKVKLGASDPMPPIDSGMPPLSPEKVAMIKLWIDQGAKYEKHWAFVSPKMPVIPTVTSKAVIRNPIDNFIVEKMTSKGLQQEKEADSATLLRRASLTLTGLLPSPEDIKQLGNDKKPGAYERAVDRLLASERYGEHEARYWLDAVRYGDTHGLHLDNERAIYPYRDWVVRSFNQDLPYDKFTLWQVAGDLLPNPTTDMKIATGYVRMNPTSGEGGAIEDEFLVRNTFDRVDTMSTVFLGLSVGCAKCHDHKFDPISTKNYYQLFAFFNSTKDAPLDSNALNAEPTVPAPTPEEDKKLTNWRAQLMKIESDTSAEEAQNWVATNRVAPPKIGPWEVSDSFVHKTFDEAFATDETPSKWKQIKIEPGVASTFIGRDNASGYVRTTIESESDAELTLRLNSDDAIKVWLNGKLVHSNKVLRGIAEAGDVVKINLKKGSNPIIIKVINATGGDGLVFNSGSDRAVRIDTAFAKKDAALNKKTFLDLKVPLRKNIELSLVKSPSSKR